MAPRWRLGGPGNPGLGLAAMEGELGGPPVSEALAAGHPSGQAAMEGELGGPPVLPPAAPQIRPFLPQWRGSLVAPR